MNASGHEHGVVGMDANRTIGRRGFLAGAAVLGAGLVTAGCSGTYDFASGFTGTSGGTTKLTLVYWNLLSGGDGAHMETMEAAYTKAHPGVTLDSTILTWGNPYYTKLAMARPAIAAVAIFTFVWTWNNFLWPFLAATSPTMMTIPAGIGTVVSGVGVVYALQMASAVLGALPLVFVFLLAQRQIVEGVAGTGLK